jgi:lipopolysaccharide export system permease protein
VKLLDRYLLKRLWTLIFFAILIFTMIWIAPELMFKAIQGISNHQLTVWQGLSFLAYQIPEVLTYCFPIAALLGTVFLFRQLSLSGELTAMLVSRISFQRILIPIGIAGVGVSLLFFLTQEFAVPWASSNLHQLSQRTHFEEDNYSNPPVTFVQKSSQGSMEKFLVIPPRGIQGDHQFIFLFYDGTGDATRIHQIMTASFGNWQAALGAWELKSGVNYFLNPEGIYSEVKPFDRELVLTSPVANALLDFPTGNPAEFHLLQLARYVQLLGEGQQTEDANFYRIRLYQRFILPLVAIVFALQGAKLGIERSRARRNLGLTYAALLLLFYNILVPLSTTLGSMGVMPSLIAAIIPLVMVVLGGGVLIKLRKFEG